MGQVKKVKRKGRSTLKANGRLIKKSIRAEKPASQTKRRSILKIRANRPDYSILGARKFLNEIFLRNGYLRLKDEDKFELYGSQGYKKGFEVRFVAIDTTELKQIRAAIRTLGFTLSQTFVNHNRIIQPLYGRNAVLDFKTLKDQHYAKQGKVKM